MAVQGYKKSIMPLLVAAFVPSAWEDDGSGAFQESTSSTWKYFNNNSCWLDDPGGFGRGPALSGSIEGGKATLGPRSYTSSESDTGDYIQWFVR